MMNPTPPASTTSPTAIPPANKAQFACTRCAERKVKCDRDVPACGGCRARRAECVYSAPRVPRRRGRQARDQALMERLRRYEALLGEQNAAPAGNKTSGEIAHAGGGVGDGSSQTRQQAKLQPAAPKLGRRIEPKAPNKQSSWSAMATDRPNSVNKTQVIQGQGRSIFVDKFVIDHSLQRVIGSC